MTYIRVRGTWAGRRLVAGRQQNINESADNCATTALRQEIQLLNDLLNVFTIFLISWLPLRLFFVGRSSITFPRFAGLLLAHGSCATDSVIYFWLTDLVQTTSKAHSRILGRFHRGKATVNSTFEKLLKVVFSTI